MTEARQKGEQKVNETRINVHKRNGDHHGYIEWIEKLDFETYQLKTEENEERTMNAEERFKIFA